MHDIQIKIIKHLVFNTQSKFSDIKKQFKDIDNNQFCFHLNTLQEKDLIQKNKNKQN
jgi:DNA-binding HxlR family transcriptional regulator